MSFVTFMSSPAGRAVRAVPVSHSSPGESWTASWHSCSSDSTRSPPGCSTSVSLVRSSRHSASPMTRTRHHFGSIGTLRGVDGQ